MTSAVFIKTVQDMKGLRPDMIERLVQLAPYLSEEDLDEAAKKLGVDHEEIKKLNADVIDALDQGIAAMDAYQRSEMGAMQKDAQKEDEAAADKILDDDDNGDQSPSFSG